jgi:hypothetical protein
MSTTVICPGTGATPAAIDPTPDLPAGIVGVTEMGLCPDCGANCFLYSGTVGKHGWIDLEIVA